MRQQVIQFSILLLCGMYVSGCATLYGRQNDEANVFFESNIENAEISCSGETVEAPGNLSLIQSKSHACTARAEGYETRFFSVRSGISDEGFDYSTKVNTKKWGIWTLGIGTLVGWSVDFVSGAMKSFSKDRYFVEMRPTGTTSRTGKVMAATKNVGTAFLKMPKEIVDETAGTIIDTTLRGGSEKVGLTSQEQREDVESAIEGKAEVKRLEEVYGPQPPEE